MLLEPLAPSLVVQLGNAVPFATALLLSVLFLSLRLEARRGAFLRWSSWSWGVLALAHAAGLLQAGAGSQLLPVRAGGAAWLEAALVGGLVAHGLLLGIAVSSIDRPLDARTAWIWVLLGGTAMALLVGLGGERFLTKRGLLAAGLLPIYLGVAWTFLRAMRWRRSLGWRLGLAGAVGHGAVELFELVLAAQASDGPAGELAYRLNSTMLVEAGLDWLVGIGCMLVFGEEMRRELASAHARLEILVDKLQRERNLDILTGSLNRLAFEERVGFEVAGIRSGSVAVFDVDGLKEVNDRYGHDAGDQLLREFVAQLRRKLRPSDLIYRLGGDEFAIILDRTRAQAAEARLRAIVESLEHIRLEGTQPPEVFLPLRASVGIAEFARLQDLTGALRRADRRMYESKRQRKAESLHSPSQDVASEILDELGRDRSEGERRDH